MSSTNKTTYYDLPQFVDNDIFNPLVDDNDAYSKIDTALHNIANAEADDASEIVGVKSRLDSAESDIDALEAQNGDDVLTTTAQTLSSAINEVNAEADALAGRVTVVEDDINNVSTGLKAKVSALEDETNRLDGAISDVAQDLSDAVTTINNKFASLSEIYVEDFGAVGDGVADDTDAFLSAFAIANVSGQTVYGKGSAYLLRTGEIIVKTSMKLNNAIIKPASPSGIVFDVRATGSTEKTITNSHITNNSTDDSDLFGKGFTLVTPLSMGLRNGTGEEYFYTQYVKVDKAGNFINGNIPVNIVAGDYKCYNITDLNVPTITLENIGVSFDHFETTTSIPIVIMVRRPNVHIKNVTLKGTFTATQNTAEVISIMRTCNTVIDGIYGGAYVALSGGSGYVVHTYESDDCVIKNCTLYRQSVDTWPEFAQTASNNIIYENVCAKRIDTHFLGTFKIRNSKLKMVLYSGGYGEITVDGCEFVDYNDNRVTWRTDFTLPFTGTIRVSNCTETNHTQATRLVNFSNDRAQEANIADFNVGKTNLVVDGCTILNSLSTVIRNGAKYSATRNEVRGSVINCLLKVKAVIDCYRDGALAPDMYPTPKFLVRGNHIIENATGIMNGSGYGTITVSDNIVEDSLKIEGGGQGAIVKGNVMAGFYGGTNGLIICDNIVTEDVEPTYASFVTRKIITNNLIQASSNAMTKIGSWNIVNPFETT